MRPSALLAAVASLIFAAIVVFSLGKSGGEPTVTVESAASVIPKDMPQPSKSGPHPKLVADEVTFDFGIMSHGSKGTHDFTIKNTGEAPLQLKIGEKSCQCTQADASKDSIPPGGETKITLAWEIRAKVVRFEHFAKLHSNDPNEPMIQLKVRGVVGQTIGSHPGGAWGLGDLSPGAVKTVQGLVLSNFNDKLEIKLKEPSPDDLKVEIKRVPEGQKGALVQTVFGEMMEELSKSGKSTDTLASWLKSVYSVTVTGSGDGKAGSFSDSVVLETNDPDQPEFTLTVTGTRPPPFEFLAPVGVRLIPKDLLLNAGEFPASEGKTMSCIIYGRTAVQDLQIEQPVCEPDSIKATITPHAGAAAKQFKLSIEIPPNFPKGTRTTSDPVLIKMKTSHPSMAELELKLIFSPQ